MESIEENIELGACIGKGQALGLIARGCTAAQAALIGQMKELEVYKKLGLTWAEFCPKYLGISRETADDLLRRLAAHGAAYFRLNEIVRISPKVYRRIRSAMQGESIEIDGEIVPITAENSARIRSAVIQMRSELARVADSQELQEYRACPDVLLMKRKMVLYLANLSSMVGHTKSPEDREILVALVRNSIDKLGEILGQYNLRK